MAYNRLTLNGIGDDLDYIDSDGDSFDGVPLQTFSKRSQSGYTALDNTCDDDVITALEAKDKTEVAVDSDENGKNRNQNGAVARLRNGVMVSQLTPTRTGAGSQSATLVQVLHETITEG